MSVFNARDREQWLIKKLPGQLIIQFTDACNASCPQCGMRRNERFRRSVLDRDRVKRIIDTAAEEDIKILSFTGGEPLLYLDDLLFYLDYAGRAGIKYTRTGTNGFVFKDLHQPAKRDRLKEIVDGLAGTSLRNFWISVDSAIPEEHEKMRGFDGIVEGIRQSLPLFHRAGIYPAANLGINRNINGPQTRHDVPPDENALHHFYYQYIEGFKKFFKTVIDLGFTTVNCCYPMSTESNEQLNDAYGASSQDRIVCFNSAEKSKLFQALYDVVTMFRPLIRTFPPRSSLLTLTKHYGECRTEPFPCLGGINYFFIDAKHGQTYPCGYRADDNYGAFEDKGWKNREHYPQCTKCDWECFRDPSTLLEPIIKSIGDPGYLLKRYKKDKEAVSVWFEDMKYYFACNFFNGRKAPDYKKMARFKKSFEAVEESSNLLIPTL